MALIDIQIVAASLNVDAGGPVGRPGRDQLGADRLSDGRARDDPASPPSSPRRCRRAGCSPLSAGLFTLSSLLCGLAWDIQSMIAVPRDPGLRRRRDGADRVRHRLRDVHRPAAGDDPRRSSAWSRCWRRRSAPPSAAGSPRRSAGAGSSSSTSCPASPSRMLCPRCWSRSTGRTWRCCAASTGCTWPRMAVFLGGLRIRAGGRPAPRLVRRPGDRHRRLALAASPSSCSSSARSSRACRSCKLTPFRRPTFVFACVFNLVIGFGLYAATYLVPVFLGRVRGYSSLQIGTTVFVTGVARSLGAPIAARPVATRRSAHRHHRRPVAVRRRPVAVLGHDAGLGLRRAVLAAGGARLRDHAVHRAERRHGAERLRAGRAALRVGPVQPDAQPRRRDRHRGGQHLAGATIRALHAARFGEALGEAAPGRHRRDRREASPAACCDLCAGPGPGAAAWPQAEIARWSGARR